MNRIKFSLFWDKLSQPSFTTIRTYRPDKEAYYRAHVGEEFTILKVNGPYSIRGRKIGTATLRSVEVVRPADLPTAEVLADVQYGGKPDLVWLNRVMAYPKALLLTFDNPTGLMGMKEGKHE